MKNSIIGSLFEKNDAPIMNRHGARVAFLENGRCPDHPDIQLRKKNAFGVWKTVKDSCPHCDRERMNTQGSPAPTFPMPVTSISSPPDAISANQICNSSAAMTTLPTTTNDDHLPSPATPTPSFSNSSDPISDGWFKMKEAMENENSRPIELPVEFIYSCTNNLNVTKKLGQGAFGAVYKGEYGNRVFAVKRILDGIAVKKDELLEKTAPYRTNVKTELEALTRFQHPNIVSLYGYHLSPDSSNQFLVYEYASKGSLDKFYESERNRSCLSSKIRFQVMFEIISAIHFLHTDTKDNFILYHRDIKSANIWLSNNYTAKLIDCGLAKFVPVDDSFSTNAISSAVRNSSNGVVFGTPGYTCPFYSKGGKTFEASCDVYSFGIVMIELVTGCLQNDRTKLGDFSECYFPNDFDGTPAEALKLAIPKLVEDADSEAEWEDGILFSVCSLAIRCIQKNREKRPKTLELVKKLGQLARPTDHVE